MFKIGVYGSSAGDLEKIIPKAHALGKALGSKDIVIITGACEGLPYEVASEASKMGVRVWGYSSAADIAGQELNASSHPASFYEKLFFIPKDFPFLANKKVSQKYRNVMSTANCDAGIIISGRWGSMNEFTNLFDMGKVIGVLTGTGGIADELPELAKKITKESKAKVFFASDPEKLVAMVMEELASRV